MSCLLGMRLSCVSTGRLKVIKFRLGVVYVQMPTTKDEGCDHMTCPRCTASWCYGCGRLRGECFCLRSTNRYAEHETSEGRYARIRGRLLDAALYGLAGLLVALVLNPLFSKKR